MAELTERREVTLGASPVPWRAWWTDVWAHRQVFAVLARQEFQTRYKRASFGILWAVIVPALQGAVMVFVFSRVTERGGADDFAAYVLSGVLAWAYFGATVTSMVTSIVDGAGLTDKVWFPRIVLVGVPAAANAVGMLVSFGVLVVALPFLDVAIGPRLLLLLPACLVLVTFTTALGLVLSALHVYYRDTRFLVQAALLVWIWVTPIVYRRDLLEGAAGWLDLNPMTGVVTLFHLAVAPGDEPWGRAVAIAVAASAVLLAAGLAAHRHHDRRFVDQL